MFNILGLKQDTEKIIKLLLKSLEKSKIKIVNVYNIEQLIKSKRKKK